MASPATGMSLTEESRKATRRVHKISDAVVLSKLLVVLAGGPGLYGRAIACFWPVYASLEAKVAAHATHPALAPVAAAYDRLARAPAIASDLAALLGADWRAAAAAEAAANPAVGAYLAHLEALEAEDPALLLGYCYGLHFVSLFGPLGKRIRGALGLAADAPGVAMYALPDSGGALRALRAAVDAGGEALSAGQRARVIEETVSMYRLNNRVVSGFAPGLKAYLLAPFAAAAALPPWAAAGAVATVGAIAAIVWMRAAAASPSG